MARLYITFSWEPSAICHLPSAICLVSTQNGRINPSLVQKGIYQPTIGSTDANHPIY
ncbi:MAG: hypothetical protein RH949_22925 [Coleofasciculus sp. A1-SPW-01]|uniref:hypothetical protein n=1 Tax=Coleofasciculus sp. A1-SPW-01 TaxID=3070819 RepID=UPI0033017F65